MSSASIDSMPRASLVEGLQMQDRLMEIAKSVKLTPGLHTFEFRDALNRIIPVHFYQAGAFVADDDDDETADDEEDEDDEQEQELASDVEDVQEDEEADAPFTPLDEEEEELGQIENMLFTDQNVIFVFHGVLRNALVYLRNWIKHAERFNLLVVCPEITQAAFPGNVYNYGALAKQTSRKACIFNSIEHIFDVFLHAGLQRDGYHIFGHSAGAQFAHRMVMWAPRRSRLIRAVAANAGWYTMATTASEFKYPYSLNRAPHKVDAELLRRAFSRKLIVMLGQQDTGLKFLNVNPQTMAQGKNRFERGINFFLRARAQAAEMDVPFMWTLRTVALCGHSNNKMAIAATKELFSVRPVLKDQQSAQQVAASETQATVQAAASKSVSEAEAEANKSKSEAGPAPIAEETACPAAANP